MTAEAVSTCYAESFTEAPHCAYERHVSSIAARALVALAVMLFAFAFACAPAHASILGDDYVGSTTVNDRGLNITQAPAIDAKYGILCDANGKVLWSRGASEHSAMASITKTMTAIVALENGNLNQMVTISKNAADVGESSVGLREGMKVDLKTLISGLLVHSGNDAAVAIAEGIGGSQDKFVEMMNAKAQQMGLKDTQFKNPHGLDAEGHYSSAADICVMVRYAMQNDLFRSVVAKKKFKLDYGNGPKTYMTTNALLATWDNCVGIKTGFTNDAGNCLASAAVKNGVELYAVVLGCNDEAQRFTDSYKLLDWGFAHYRPLKLASAQDNLVDVPLSGWLDRTVEAGVAKDVNACVFDYDGDISVDVKMVDVPDGVDEGETVGTISWRQSDNLVARTALVARKHVGSRMPWTSVITAAVRLLGVFTGDDCIADAVLHVQSLPVEVAGGGSGQVVSSKLDKAIHKYIAAYNASLY